MEIINKIADVNQETLNGATTIRAFRLIPDFLKTNHKKTDVNNAVNFCNLGANRWLTLRLELIGGSIVSLSALFAVIQRSSVNAGMAGLSIVYALQMTQLLSWMVRTYTQAETDLVSVERVLTYSEIAQEAPPEIPSNRPDPQWPSGGAIEFRNVVLRYREGLELVLQDTTFDVKPSEKIGIVGRTGAGKSSLMVALFRLVELTSGSILIDGVDISQIGLHDLRSKLSMIPQDPTLFEGTVRFNLDPFNE